MRCRVALILLTGVLAAQTPKPDAKGTISGVVKDTSGTPVAEIPELESKASLQITIAPVPI
jgi:hypothetical protein